MSNEFNKKATRQAIISIINGLMQDLSKLSPHPDRADNISPIFLKCNAAFKPANDHDSMIGTMMLEGLLGAAFSEAIADITEDWAQDFDVGNAADCCSEYIKDSDAKAQIIASHGQGTMARIAGRSIASSFNMHNPNNTAMQNFMDDLPKRLLIERNLAYYARELENIDTPLYQYAA